jgi:predicted RNA binding protein YcfA (HicA-like mRNA interferase family)
MSVKRRDLIRYLEKSGFYLLREGGDHSIYTNGKKVIPVKTRKLSLPGASVLLSHISAHLC